MRRKLAIRLLNGVTRRWLRVLQRGESIAKKLLRPFKPPQKD